MEQQELALLVISVLSLMVGFTIGFLFKYYQVKDVEYSDEPIEEGDIVVHKTNEDITWVVTSIRTHYVDVYRYVGLVNQIFTTESFTKNQLLKIKTK
jgi:ABC-type amino acid transport system permease subunit